MTDEVSQQRSVEKALRRIQVKLPGPVKFRVQNSLDHFDQALEIFTVDRAMASFRAITGEEEAYSALIKAIQLRSYANADQFSVRRHDHKVAVGACIAAVTKTMIPILKQFQIIFDFEKVRIDIKIPISTFRLKIADGSELALQPVEPLDITYAREGLKSGNLFADELRDLAEGAKFKTIKAMVKVQANARNTLLYASDTDLPRSRATLRDLELRRSRACTALVLAVMVLQSQKQLPLVRDAIVSFLGVISRLPVTIQS